MFKSLNIEKRYSFDSHYPGQIVAKLMVEGEKGDGMTVVIGEPGSLKILHACAQILSDAAAERAVEFRDQLLAAIKPAIETTKE